VIYLLQKLKYSFKLKYQQIPHNHTHDQAWGTITVRRTNVYKGIHKLTDLHELDSGH
jgi:hypothetical protein